MRRIFVGLSIMGLILVLGGCAALFNSKTSSIQMNSNPVGASVIVDGNRVGTTPMSIDLSNKAEHTVVFRMDGRDDVTCMINRKVGAGWVVLDVLGGLVPVIIDAATGSWYELDKNTCNGNLGGEIDLETLNPEISEAYGGVY